MKKNILLPFTLSACLFSGSLAAQSKLSITLVSNAAIRTVIDDRQYLCQDNSLTIEDLPAGFHSVKIFMVRKDRWNNSRAGQMVYNGNIQLKTQFYTDIVVNRFGKTMLDEQPLSRGDFYDNMDRDYDRDRDQHHPVDPRGGNGGYGSNNGNNNQPYAMTDEAFATAREAVRKENFDDNRLSVARQIVDANYFTTAQVKEMAKLFSFEDRKLDFVKYAYGHTVDRNNYYTLNEVFNFPSSKEELANYIKNYK